MANTSLYLLIAWVALPLVALVFPAIFVTWFLSMPVVFAGAVIGGV